MLRGVWESSEPAATGPSSLRRSNSSRQTWHGVRGLLRRLPARSSARGIQYIRRWRRPLWLRSLLLGVPIQYSVRWNNCRFF
jgi:hypothetical protein